MNMRHPLWILTGPTASGKTETACHVARKIGAEIISADSMQVYLGMDIGTAKPPLSTRNVPYHLIDILDPWESYSVGRYVLDVQRVVKDVEARGKRHFIVGGTGLYIKALREGLFKGPDADWALREELAAVAEEKGSPYLHGVLSGIDPKSAQRIHQTDLRRIIRALEVYQKTGRAISQLQQEWGKVCEESVLIVLARSREDLHQRIEARVDSMFKQGLVGEVQGLINHPLGLSKQARAALGYKEVIGYLEGKPVVSEANLMGLDETRDLIKKNTRRFAKRQMTWFRSFSGARWLEVKQGESPEETAEKVLEILGP